MKRLILVLALSLTMVFAFSGVALAEDDDSIEDYPRVSDDDEMVIGVQSSDEIWVCEDDGSDDYSGTEDEPFETIGYAIDQASGDQTIYVKPGTYNEAFNIDVDNLTLQAVDSDGDVIDASENSAVIIDAQGTDRAIDLDADDVRIEGFRVKNFGELAFYTGDAHNKDANDFEIVNNFVPENHGDHGVGTAINIANANEGLIEGNVFYAQQDDHPERDDDVGVAAANILWSDNITINDNTIDSSHSQRGLATMDVESITIEGNQFTGDAGDVAVVDSTENHDLVEILEQNDFEDDRAVVTADNEIANVDNLDEIMELTWDEEYAGDIEFGALDAEDNTVDFTVNEGQSFELPVTAELGEANVSGEEVQVKAVDRVLYVVEITDEEGHIDKGVLNDIDPNLGNEKDGYWYYGERSGFTFAYDDIYDEGYEDGETTTEFEAAFTEPGEYTATIYGVRVPK